MGLKERSTSATWLSLSHGKFILKQEDGSKKEFPALEGLIVGLGFQDADYEGKKYHKLYLSFADGGDTFKVSFDAASGYGRQTLMKLPNCDLTQPVELSPSYKEEGAKKSTGMFLSQCGQSIKQKWTRDNPGDLPQMEQVMFKGEAKWDDTAQMKYLEEYVQQHLFPVVLANAGRANSRSAGGSREVDTQEAAPDEYNQAADAFQPSDPGTGDVPF